MGLTVLDTGVLIAVLSARNAHHETARSAIAVALERGDRLVLPASAYAELLVGPLRQKPPSDSTIDEFLDALPVTIEPATREIARTAAELRASGRLRLPDALVLATAITLDADRVLTTDARWPDTGLRVDVVGAIAT